MKRKLLPMIAFAAVFVAIQAAADDDVVADGMDVSVEYTLTLTDKTVITSNVGQEPLVYQQGHHDLPPGLEKALAGMKVGETKHVELAAADAYGPYEEEGKITVKREQVPPDVKPDMTLSGPDGRTVKVLEVNEKEVVLDLNHPLAGKDVVFDVKVVKIEKAKAAPAPESAAAPPK